MSTLRQAFWALVIGTLALLAGGLLLAPGLLLGSPTYVGLLVVCGILWLLHSADVRAHHDEDAHDRRLHRTQERRGF